MNTSPNDAPSVRQRCAWPRGIFSMRDEPDPHGHTWMILPDGWMLDVSHHADPTVNPAQVAWMVDVLNLALANNAADPVPAMAKAAQEAVPVKRLGIIHQFNPLNAMDNVRPEPFAPEPTARGIAMEGGMSVNQLVSDLELEIERLRKDNTPTPRQSADRTAEAYRHFPKFQVAK